MFNTRRAVRTGSYYLAWAMVVVGVLLFAHFDYGILNSSGFSLTKLGPIVTLTGIALFSVNLFLKRERNLGFAFLAVGCFTLAVHISSMFVKEGEPGDFLVQKEYATPLVTELSQPVSRSEYFWSEIKIVKRKLEYKNEYKFEWSDQTNAVLDIDYAVEMIDTNADGALRILRDKDSASFQVNIHHGYHHDKQEERAAIIARVKDDIRNAMSKMKNYHFTKLEVKFK